MTMLAILSCSHGIVSSPSHDFNGKPKVTIKPKRAVVTAFPRAFLYNSRRIGWSRSMGGQCTSINLTIQGLPLSIKEESRLRPRWGRESVRSDMFAKLSPGNNSWLGKYLKLEKSKGDGDSQKTAVVDVHIRFSLSEPKSLADAASRFAPPWFKLLKTAQPLLPLLLPSGGGGNRDGDFFRRLGYGGDDDSNKSRHRKRRLVLGLHQWWAMGVALTSLVVWAMRAYSGIPQRVQFSISICGWRLMAWLNVVRRSILSLDCSNAHLVDTIW